MIATGSILHIQPSSYMPATAPITHAVMLPIGTINLYVGFTGSSDPADPLPRSVPLDGPYAYDDGIFGHVEPTAANTEPFPSSGEEHARSSDLEDDADSAVPPQIARSEASPTSEVGSIVAASINQESFAGAVGCLVADDGEIRDLSGPMFIDMLHMLA